MEDLELHPQSSVDLTDIMPAKHTSPVYAEPVPQGDEHQDEKQKKWHVEAGRKGAQRLHQLIEEGKLYEREHGLKSGRQRLRQLLELGKQYEQEHGLATKPVKEKSIRMSSNERKELLGTFLYCLTRLVKSEYKADLLRVAESLHDMK